LGALWVTGCTGQIGDSDLVADDPAGGPVPVGRVAGCDTMSPGPSLLRRLTRFEYDNTVADLLGDTSAPANAFPPEEQSLGFDNDNTVLRVPALLAESYVTAAQTLTDRALIDVRARTGCDPAVLATDPTRERACAVAFVTSFGERAYRRPLQSDEQTRLMSVYDTSRATFDLQGSIAAVMETVLLSPQFMYRVEFARPIADHPGIEAVDAWGMASRLSYFLWGSMPDTALIEAARAGTLQTRDGVRQQAERMFDDPRTRSVVRHFHDDWLELLQIDGQGKDGALFPDYTVGTGTLLRQQTEAFAEDVYFDAAGDQTMLSRLHST
jgi:hypothetical protein